MSGPERRSRDGPKPRGLPTCPVPPEQNKLPIRIEAGEKMYYGGAHQGLH